MGNGQQTFPATQFGLRPYLSFLKTEYVDKYLHVPIIIFSGLSSFLLCDLAVYLLAQRKYKIGRSWIVFKGNAHAGHAVDKRHHMLAPAQRLQRFQRAQIVYRLSRHHHAYGFFRNPARARIYLERVARRHKAVRVGHQVRINRIV